MDLTQEDYLMNHNISRLHIAVKNFEIVNISKCTGHLGRISYNFSFLDVGNQRNVLQFAGKVMIN